MIAITKRGGREHHLDGLRGMAALVVVLQHIGGLLPGAYPTVGDGMLGRIEIGVLTLPFRAGIFAVYVFFAISGVVIAGAADRDRSWPLSLISRYLRLTVPMLAASLFAWGLLWIFPNALAAIGVFLPDHLTTEVYNHGDASLLDAFREPLWRAYMTGTVYLNPVLWSMKVELFGSIGILTFYRFAPAKMRIPGAIVILVLLACVGRWRYMPFALGPVIYELNRRKPISDRFESGMALVAAGIVVAIIGEAFSTHLSGKAFSDVVVDHDDLRVIAYSAGGILVVLGVIAGGRAREILLLKAPQFLGRISYGLYLIHMPLLYTVFAAFYLRLGAPPGWTSIVPWAATFLLSAIVAGYVMTVAIDEPSSAVRRRLDRLFH